MVVKSEIVNLTSNEAATMCNGVLEYSTFAKGDSWACCK